MTLEELLKLLEAAQAAAKADPEDEDLKKAVEEAQAAYDAKKAESDDQGDPDPDKLDESSMDDKTKKYLAKLRKENAGHRTKSKDLASKVKAEQDRVKAILKAAGIESQDEKPEEQIKNLTGQTQSLAFSNAILETAVEHGIPKEGLKYFKFLVSEATGELEEGEELSDDKLAEIVAEVKKGRTAKSASSSVGGGQDGGGNPPPPGGSKTGSITLEKFCSMSISEKSALYEKNRDLYVSLMTEAKAKKKLV
jgi:hypothetical protein